MTSGTWSVAMAGSTSGTFTMNGSATGEYRKIGDMYTCFIRAQWTSKSTASGDIQISLPATIGTDRVAFAVGWAEGLIYSSSEKIACYGETGNAFVEMVTNQTLATPAVFADADYSTTGLVMLSGSFFV